jgi:hypothetical protein
MYSYPLTELLRTGEPGSETCLPSPNVRCGDALTCTIPRTGTMTTNHYLSINYKSGCHAIRELARLMRYRFPQPRNTGTSFLRNFQRRRRRKVLGRYREDAIAIVAPKLS